MEDSNWQCFVLFHSVRVDLVNFDSVAYSECKMDKNRKIWVHCDFDDNHLDFRHLKTHLNNDKWAWCQNIHWCIRFCLQTKVQTHLFVLRIKKTKQHKHTNWADWDIWKDKKIVHQTYKMLKQNCIRITHQPKHSHAISLSHTPIII